MEAVLLVIHLIVAIGIIAVVMLQPSEAGGGLVGGGSNNAMMPRRSADAMTRLTTIFAACFFCTSLLLAILASRGPSSKGILELVGENAPAVEAPASPASSLAPEHE